MAAGPGIDRRERVWAAEMASLVEGLVGKRATLGLERLNAGTAIALRDHGLRIVDAQRPVEMANAFRLAIEAGRAGFEAGLMEARDLASPSTPVVGTPFWHAVS